MENNQRRDDSPSGLSDIVEGDGLLGTGLTVCAALFFLYFFLAFSSLRSYATLMRKRRLHSII